MMAKSFRVDNLPREGLSYERSTTVALAFAGKKLCLANGNWPLVGGETSGPGQQLM
jgi:hypothetical protein